jgi:hypothetical protein
MAARTRRKPPTLLHRASHAQVLEHVEIAPAGYLLEEWFGLDHGSVCHTCRLEPFERNRGQIADEWVKAFFSPRVHKIEGTQTQNHVTFPIGRDSLDHRGFELWCHFR